MIDHFYPAFYNHLKILLAWGFLLVAFILEALYNKLANISKHFEGMIQIQTCCILKDEKQQPIIYALI